MTASFHLSLTSVELPNRARKWTAKSLDQNPCRIQEGNNHPHVFGAVQRCLHCARAQPAHQAGIGSSEYK